MKQGTLIWLMVCVGGLSHAHMTQQSSPASVRLAAPRSPNQPLRLQAYGFNQEHQLALKPAPSPFAANFKIHTTTRDHQGRLQLQEVEVADNDLSTIYHDPDTGAVVSVDGSSVDGLLTPTLAIKPSPDGGHQLIRLEPPVETSSDIVDYLELPHDLRFNPDEVVVSRAVESSTPELLIVVDSVMAASFGKDLAKIKNYLGIFYNSVNQRYATMTDPQIQMIISGLIVVTNPADETFIKTSTVNSNGIDDENTLDAFGEWLFKKNADLSGYDMAYLMTGRDMVTPEGHPGVAGLAWVGAACSINSQGQKNMKSGMGEDTGGVYNGVMTAVHELAHILGAYHDGKNTNTAACPWDDGYIMSYVRTNKNQFYFSSCSKNLMKKYIASSFGACLKTTDTGAKVPISSSLPGSGTTIDDQCKKLTGKSNAYANVNKSEEELCMRLSCQWKQQEGYYTYTYTRTFGQGAPEGTACKSGGYCMAGECKK